MKDFFRLFKVNKLKAFIILITFIINTVATGYLLYAISLLNGIENKVRLLLAIVLGIAWIIFVICYRKSIKKGKSKYGLFIPITIIYALILSFGAFYIVKTVGIIGNMTSDSTTYSSSLITLTSNKIDKISKVPKSSKVGMLGDDTSIDGYQIPKEIIKDKKMKNKVLEYESYISLLKGLYDGEVEYAFLPTNYTVMFQNMEEAELQNLKEDTKIIYTKEKKVKKSSKSKKSSTLNKPFTILLMGVDSENENLASSSFNGDSLILITFNPTTLNTTMLSIPRDSYVPIMCFAGHKKNKITHAAWYGEDCMMKTIENFTGINIDYFVKINFKGVVKMVDTLGGVDVDVPYSFCEQNSNREWGNNTVYVDKGMQTLDGEKALAFSRNRHPWPSYCGAKYSNYNSNDFIRGQNQQTVIRALMNKLKTVRNLDTVYELLDTISNSMQTNMTTNEILSLYNVGKDIIIKSNGGEVEDLLGIQRLYLSGSDAHIYDPGSGLNLYNYVLSQDSLDAVVEAMEINLGKKKPKIVKEFSFSIDNPYEEEVIGKNLTGNLQKYDKTEKKSSTKCGTNQELGADGVTCVCKAGYKKVNGVCSKEESTTTQTKKTCGTNEELGADGVTCVCKNGYTKTNGTCTKQEEQKKCTGSYEQADPDANGNCICMSGYKRVDGVCTKEEITCSGNKVLVGGKCKCDSTNGYVDDGNGNCILDAINP